MKNFKTALLVSTYNWPEALALVFKSVEKQSKLPDEFIIADDGSAPETTALIAAFKKESGLNVIHVWHEDDGFKRSEILNKAIAQSTSDYIVQTDGDCIIHPRFIEDHVAFAVKNQYLFGSRVSITEEYRDELFEQQNIKYTFLHKGIKKRTRALYIPFLSSLYGVKNKLSKKLRGCNVSFWREDFIAVNGYNEAMKGWGREDSELIIRMMNKGVQARRLRYRGIVYHIWHKVASKGRVNINEEIQQKAIKEELDWCENGVDKYLN